LGGLLHRKEDIEHEYGTKLDDERTKREEKVARMEKSVQQLEVEKLKYEKT